MAEPADAALRSTTKLVRDMKRDSKYIKGPYRKLFNALNASLTEFTSTLVSGKAIAASISNDVLQSYVIGDWVETLGLTPAAGTSARSPSPSPSPCSDHTDPTSMLRDRLDVRIQRSKDSLVRTLEVLRRIVEDLAGALGEFQSGAFAHWTTGGDVDAESMEVIKDVAMCGDGGSLTFRQVCCAVEGMVCFCRKEVEEVKAVVVGDIVAACARYRGEESKRYRTQGWWEVRVVAWVTDVYFERDDVERNMATMAADAGLPYFVK